ncbi:hypothetical protein M409DRAFT_19903 [Zasmidium cellare ATCC 36951]|uniref:Amidohydrolase-related domain-containing protein n=1 Tax=Zasmidium cellare ATCC 36951 TaxID=1080233 RepID=A0A6A6CT81_ZASCE|nr:uncharacterized protein M409DRAFT_19903 [Zasmidium cellare ATCC 36951]KAF2170301.1 hypothetical protein M409DRAFT_19903 [Zasmidium cellare ATCC 36951]
MAMKGLVPEYSWDSQMHVIDPERFPLSPNRSYTPKSATREQAAALEAGCGIAHTVVVLPSVYGTDNSVLLDALKYFNGTARGVCVVDPDSVSNDTLARYHEAGVRGVRVNFGANGKDSDIVEAVKKNAAVARRHDWVLELWIPLKAFKALHSTIPDLGVRVMADHFAHAEVGSRVNNTLDTIDPYHMEGFSEAIDLISRKLLFVTLSAPYQCSNDAPLYQDMRVVAQTLMINGPEMVVYASGWPHTVGQSGNSAAGRLVPQDFLKVNDFALIDLYKEWAGSPAQVHRLFVDNPRRLWQWTDPDS